MKRVLLQLFALIVCASAYAAETPLQVVVRLYRDYAFEALIDKPMQHATLTTASKAEKERYLDDTLIALLTKDAECQKSSGEICNLDFVPIWASQDPTVASHVSITAETNPSVVDVQFNNGDEQTTLKYHLVETPRGWRIADIEYPSGPSLATKLRK